MSETIHLQVEGAEILLFDVRNREPNCIAVLDAAAALELAERLRQTALAQLRAAPGLCGLCADQGTPHGCEACGLKRLGLLGVDGQPYYAVFQSRKRARRVEVEL